MKKCSVKVTRLGTLVPPKTGGPAQYLLTSEFVFMDNYLLDIISKVTVCLFFFVISNINHKIMK